MGFAIQQEKGKYYSEMVCDACRKQIEDWSQAVVCCSAPEEGQATPAMVFCKHDENEKTRLGASMDMDVHLSQLIINKQWEIIQEHR